MKFNYINLSLLSFVLLNSSIFSANNPDVIIKFNENCNEKINSEYAENIKRNHFVIITPSYKNASINTIPGKGQMRVCDWNLSTILGQQIDNNKFTCELIYIDDNSPDDTGLYVKEYVSQLVPDNMKVTIQINGTRKLALQNLWESINKCNDEDIVLILDGDDGFANPRVLKFLDQVYSNPNIWITYGQYRELRSGNLGFNAPMPYEIVVNNNFRQHGTLPTHLRTFKAGLAKKIKVQDLMKDGQYFPMTYDMALMIPMMEMASKGHFRFISEILYTYNDNNPISDHRVNKTLQREIDLYIRSLPPYQPLDKLN